MMRLLIATVGALTLFASCSQKNELCKCIEDSEHLNDLSFQVMQLDEVPVEKFEELQRLRNRMDSICQPFMMMGPEELYKLRNECIDPELRELENG